MSKDIKSFFKATPPSKTEGKFKRARSSPELENTPKRRLSPAKMQRSPQNKVQELDKYTVKQLMESFNALLDSKSYSTKEDIEKLQESVESMKEENKKLKEEIMAVRKKEELLNKRVDALENKMKQNNLVLKGIETTATDKNNCSETVINICRDILDVKLESKDVINAYCIGNRDSEKRPILATFNNASTVYKILNKTRKLQGTGIAVDRDLCASTRRQRGKLLKIRKEAMKINRNIRIYTRTDHLQIGEKRFYWDEEVGLTYKRKEGVGVLNEVIGGDLSQVVNELRGEPDTTA